MTFSLTPEDVRKSTQVPKKPYAIGLMVLLAIGVLGLALIGNFAYSQRSNALLGLQQVMGGVADVRAGAVGGWVQQQQAPLARFADDQDVRLSVMQILEPSADLDLASRGYLRNWLANLARENGYLPPEPAGDIPADVSAPGTESGMAVIGRNGEVLVSVGAFPHNADALKTYLSGYTLASSRLLDIFSGQNGQALIGFAYPVFSVTGGNNESDRIGLVVGIKPVADELWPLLVQPGSTIKTARVSLLRQNGETVEILSPGPDSPALSQRYALSHAGLIEAEAVMDPGRFFEGRDHTGAKAVGVSRAVPGTPWFIAYQVGYENALLETDTRLFYQKLIFLVLLGAVMALLYGAWRRGAARIASEKALEYAALARKYDFQGRLLRLVTDSQRNHILIADTEGRVRFANATLARAMGTLPEDMVGKPMAAAVGPDSARRFAKRAQESTLSNKAVVTVDRVPGLKEGDHDRIVQTQHIPLEDNSHGPDRPPAHGTLIVEEDITDLVMEREKREQVLRGVVDALVSVVDRRDPYAAEHSGRVARLSRLIAVEMGLPTVEADTAELAGALLNLGKLLVPAQLLTKTTALDEAELKVVRDSLLASADIVSCIAFEGPVVETIRQSMERVDGSGFPKGLQGDDILPTARIVAVANTFVALISSRAHRAGLPIDKAIATLMEQADRTVDRGVVAALVSYLDNKGGRDEWELVAPPPEPDTSAEENPWQR